MKVTFNPVGNPVEFWITIINLLLRLFAGWASFTLFTWMGAPEWMVITLTVMAVVSTRLEYTETRG